MDDIDRMKRTAVEGWEEMSETGLDNMTERGHFSTALPCKSCDLKRRRIAELEQALAEAQRREELLRGELANALEKITAWYDSNFIYVRYASSDEEEQYLDTVKRLQAAVDGGALAEGE